MLEIQSQLRSAAIFLFVSATISVGILDFSLAQLHRLKALELPKAPRETASMTVTERPATMYKAYLKEFGKHYEGKELEKRFRIFKKSLKKIARLNSQSGANYGLTKFADVDVKEVMGGNSVEHVKNYGAKNGTMANLSSSMPYSDRDSNIPKKFDWREEGYVGPVLDQKKCNGCWAFSIVGVMETMVAIKNSRFGPRLSVQEVIDCTNGEGGTNGCNGGNVLKALELLRDKHMGIVTEDEYPLKLVTQPCSLHNTEGVKIKRFWNEYEVAEDKIIETLYNHGPVMVVVNAASWYFYIDGVIQRECRPNTNPNDDNDDVLSHVVQIVGYDLSREIEDVPYYIVRNSYGEEFGLDGYLKLAYGNNVCGVTDELSYLDVY